METYIVKTEELTKRYKGRTVVDCVNMHVKQGEIYGFVGPNGAGKSTVLKMLLNLEYKDAGSVFLFNQKVEKENCEFLGRIGALIEYPYFYEQLTGRENLMLHCNYMGIHNAEAVEKAIKAVSLNEGVDRKVSQYSVGMKQRLAIARAILTRPDLLILDEPINGLDPDGILEIRNLLLKLKQESGMTIIISSHILSEMELLADTVGIIKDGKLIKEISMQEIREENISYVEIEVDDVKTACVVLEELDVENYDIISESTIRIYDLTKGGKEITAALSLRNIGVESLRRKENNLEDYFFKLTRGEYGRV